LLVTNPGLFRAGIMPWTPALVRVLVDHVILPV
jgi:hypothetical protein